MKNINKIIIIIVAVIFFFVYISSAQSRRDKHDQPERLLDVAGVKPGMLMGEAGAGEGYFTFYLSRRVGNEGRVFANDIDEKALQELNNRSVKEGVKNIETVLGEITDPCFPETNLDMIVMLYAFHDFSEKEAWLKNAKKYMKNEAKLVIFDAQSTHTRMSKELVTELSEKAGFILVQHKQLHNGIWVYILNIN